MADLIDRQAALNTLCDNCDTVQAVCPHYPCKRYTSIENMPSADAVEVVRCKDCLMHGVCRFERGLGLDGYCSQAKRREDG